MKWLLLATVCLLVGLCRRYLPTRGAGEKAGGTPAPRIPNHEATEG